MPEFYKFKERAFEKGRRFPKYVQLFDLVYKQDKYDEEAIVRALKGEKINDYLPRLKNYLYHKILEFIRDANTGEESELHGILEKVRILFYKRLYHHLPLIINRGKAIAYQIEDFHSIRKLINFEIGVLRELYGPDKYALEVPALLDEEEMAWQKESNRAELLRIEARFQVAWNLSGQERHEYVGPYLLDPMISDSTLALSNSARIIQLQIQWLASFFKGEFSQLVGGTDEIIRIFEDFPGLMEDRSMYDSLVKAILYSSAIRVRSNDFDHAYEKFSKLNSLAKAEKKTPQMYFEQEAIFWLFVALKKSDKETGQKAISKYLETEKSNHLEPNTKSEINISHLSSLFWLYSGNPRMALPWINRNRNRKRDSVRPDLKMASRLLFVVCHWELGNSDVVEREIRSIRTSWGRHKLMNEYYDFFLGTFKSLVLQKSPEREVMVEALETLEQNNEIPLWIGMSNYFHFRDWLKAKIEKRTVFEINSD